MVFLGHGWSSGYIATAALKLLQDKSPDINIPKPKLGIKTPVPSMTFFLIAKLKPPVCVGTLILRLGVLAPGAAVRIGLVGDPHARELNSLPHSRKVYLPGELG